MKFKFVIFFFLIVTICQTQVQKRDYYKALLEPKKGVLHGAWLDSVGFLEYVGTVEEKQYPIIYMTYTSLLDKDKLINYGEHLTNLLQGLPKDVIPQIGLSFVSGKHNGAGQDNVVTEGFYDENIQLLVSALRKFNRIGYEFEGGWNGYKLESYKTTFVKIAKAIKDANLNVATVWYSGGSPIAHSKLIEYYPCDEWVDWWDVDIFSPKEMTFPTLFEFLAMAYATRTCDKNDDIWITNITNYILKR